ncbi:MAG: BCCT family transporter, partial [Gammaproteobacteria bacterium]|nr:BCCT family transporter [Gammaproteobacteria bacterium]
MLDRLAAALGLSAIPVVFFGSAGLAVLFVAFALPFAEQFAAFFGLLTDFTVTYFGWFYILSVTGLLIFLIWVALSRYGSIRLSQDHERPEFGTWTWFTMLFAAGIGTILMFW